MTAKTAPQYKEVYDALCAGETIQEKVQVNPELWVDQLDMSFHLPPECYRIKPKPREWWLRRAESLSQVAALFEDVPPPMAGHEVIHVREVLP